MSKHRLLVVEDDEAVRLGWVTIFAQRGWDVVATGTVAGGLALLDPAPDYLILDLTLPDGDGAVVLRSLREANLKTRVAVTTGDSDPTRLGVIRAMNPEAVFLKPFDVVDVWCEGELARTA